MRTERVRLEPLALARNSQEALVTDDANLRRLAGQVGHVPIPLALTVKEAKLRRGSSLNVELAHLAGGANEGVDNEVLPVASAEPTLADSAAEKIKL